MKYPHRQTEDTTSSLCTHFIRDVQKANKINSHLTWQLTFLLWSTVSLAKFFQTFRGFIILFGIGLEQKFKNASVIRQILQRNSDLYAYGYRSGSQPLITCITGWS